MSWKLSGLLSDLFGRATVVRDAQHAEQVVQDALDRVKAAEEAARQAQSDAQRVAAEEEIAISTAIANHYTQQVQEELRRERERANVKHRSDRWVKLLQWLISLLQKAIERSQANCEKSLKRLDAKQQREREEAERAATQARQTLERVKELEAQLKK